MRFGPRAVLLDCGDTLVDESTEIKDASGATLRAELIPGAEELVRTLYRHGCPIALVADGPVATFENILRPRGLMPLFGAHAISGAIGVTKPHAGMFRWALDGLGVHRRDYPRVVMVGNNLRRDIAGAKSLGLSAIWMRWSGRRRQLPRTASEIPDRVAVSPLDVLRILRTWP